ncbi:MAG: hypothetical protein KatS3mg026_1429 [Bacteroidia bacterium]|nr:MAG: hypothetical protein KatS3mg026_1429 [Bacteroidia bacterium]
MKGHLYFLLKAPLEGAVPTPLPPTLAAETIEASLWSPEEKALLRTHTAYLSWEFPLQPDPIEAFLQAYRKAASLPELVGIANPLASTAHTAKWAQRLFQDGLEAVARHTPPLHLWTGLKPFQVEPTWEALLAGQPTYLWLRTVGYTQFGLPELAHPLQDLRETGWIHSLFELLFDWMYFGGRVLQPGDALEVPERGRYLVKPFGSGLLALLEYREAPT